MTIKKLLTVSLLFLVTPNGSFQAVTLVCTLHVNVTEVAHSAVPPFQYFNRAVEERTASLQIQSSKAETYLSESLCTNSFVLNTIKHTWDNHM